LSLIKKWGFIVDIARKNFGSGAPEGKLLSGVRAVEKILIYEIIGKK